MVCRFVFLIFYDASMSWFSPMDWRFLCRTAGRLLIHLRKYLSLLLRDTLPNGRDTSSLHRRGQKLLPCDNENPEVACIEHKRVHLYCAVMA